MSFTIFENSLIDDEAADRYLTAAARRTRAS